MAIIDWYTRFMNGPQVKPLTPREKARLAAKNLLDPFNAITIFGTAAISVGSNPDSPYGPGMPGFGRYVGVSYTQDLTGEFFNTFLIPSLMHQDPHYHRMPHASIVRRIAHTAEQVVWTQGDNGRGMLNYATLAGYAIDDEIGNLYVPGRQTNLPASATRYGVGLARHGGLQPGRGRGPRPFAHRQHRHRISARRGAADSCARRHRAANHQPDREDRPGRRALSLNSPPA